MAWGIVAPVARQMPPMGRKWAANGHWYAANGNARHMRDMPGEPYRKTECWRLFPAFPRQTGTSGLTSNLNIRKPSAILARWRAHKALTPPKSFLVAHFMCANVESLGVL